MVPGLDLVEQMALLKTSFHIYLHMICNYRLQSFAYSIPVDLAIHNCMHSYCIKPCRTYHRNNNIWLKKSTNLRKVKLYFSVCDEPED